MSLAWLVMLPLGMVNVAYVATWEEYGETWAQSTHLSPQVAMAVCGWAVFLVSWYVATKLSPPMSDNHPRLQPEADVVPVDPVKI